MTAYLLAGCIAVGGYAWALLCSVPGAGYPRWRTWVFVAAMNVLVPAVALYAGAVPLTAFGARLYVIVYVLGAAVTIARESA